VVARPSKAVRKSVSERERTAHHEAGHAVLSAAINDAPHFVSIRPRGGTLGRSGQRMFARPTSLVQVHVAGFAAEHLLTRRRPRQFDQELGMALMSVLDPTLCDTFPNVKTCDGYMAVREVLKVAVLGADEIRHEVDRLYEIARESLATVWPAVAGVARALLRHEELDRAGLDAAIGDVDIYGPVVAVQRAHGLMLSCSTAAP
jgi:hypothetical protein